MTQTLPNPGGARTATIYSAYDALGNQTLLNDPDKGQWVYVYDALGRLRRQQDAVGNVTITSYDLLGRQLTRTVTEAAGPVETTNWYYYETDTTKPHAVSDPEVEWIGALQRETVTMAWAGHTTDALRNYTVERSYYYDTFGRVFLDLHHVDGKW